MKKLLQLLRNNAAQQRQPITIVQAADAGETTLYLYDIIEADWGVSAMDVSKAIASLEAKSTLRMRINSPGGDVFEARAIVTAMRDFRNAGGKIICQVDSLAASAASWIAVEGDEVEMADGAFMMIHNAMGLCFGSAADMTAMAAVLSKVEGSIVAEYVQATGKTTEQIQSWLDAETWFTAQECVDNGFADRIVSTLAEKPTNVAAGKWNLAGYDKTPEALLKPPVNEPDPATVRAHNDRRLALLKFA